jgi:hypothetical protein
MNLRKWVTVDRLSRSLRYFLVTALCVGGLAAAHGTRIVDNWHAPQWEDAAFFEHNDEEVHSLWDCFAKTGVWPGRYLPLTTNLYYYVGAKAWSNRVEAYHSVNLLFLILNAVLLYRLAENLVGAWWAMIPAVLFASRLAMVEVVLHTCEFQGLFYSFFTILSADLFIRSRKNSGTRLLVLSAVTFVLALLSKEAAVVLPAILIVYGRLFDDKPYSRPYLVHPIIAVTWAILFVLMLPAHNQSNGMVNDFSIFNLLRNYSAYGLVFSNWILTPLQDFVMPRSIAGLAAKMHMLVLMGALIILEGAALLFPGYLKADGPRLVVFGFAWFLITTLPFTIFADRLFMRYGYLGHAGLALCVGGLVESIVRWFSTRRPAALPQVAEASHA